MRYRPQTRQPRYIGAVDKYDVYTTPMGNIIARFSDDYMDFISLGKVPYRPGHAKRVIHHIGNEDVTDRIDALIQCFAPDICKT